MTLEYVKSLLTNYNSDIERLYTIGEILKFRALSSKTSVFRMLRLLQKQSEIEQRIKRIVTAMNKLQKKYRLVLILKYVRNVKNDKIIKFFKISHRTLYRWCNRGLVMFKIELEERQ